MTAVYEPDCDGIWSPPVPVAHRDDEYDAAHFATLTTMQRDHFWYRGRHRFVTQALRWALRRTKLDQRRLKLVDVGGGCGGWINELSARSERLLPGGVDELALADSSRVALQLAAGHLPGGVRRYQVDVLNMNWHDRWDVIFLLDVLEHIPDDIEALRQVRQALTPGGIAIVTTPALRRFWTWNDDLVHHCRRYSRPDFARVAHAAGLQLFDSRYFQFFLSPLLLLSRWSRQPPWRNMTVEQQADLIARTHRVPHPLINMLLGSIFAAETPLGHAVHFPWGTSILGVFRKPDESQ
jgi:2-polyprenyl-3-methyl-5-hydroxy-6-metoxy-1,4-benzoquinol methylase